MQPVWELLSQCCPGALALPYRSPSGASLPSSRVAALGNSSSSRSAARAFPASTAPHTAASTCAQCKGMGECLMQMAVQQGRS